MDDASERAAARERAILSTAAEARGAAVLVAVNLNNMKAFNAVLGHAAGDEVLRGVEHGLARLGPAWRTAGDEFVALVAGELAQARDRVRAFTWLYNVRIGCTDAWEFCFADGRDSLLVPSAHLEVVCSPRCGLAEVGSDPAHALELARRRCHQAAIDPGLHQTLGFAPVVRQPWARARKLASPGCPLCKHDRPVIVESDLGWSKERCPECEVVYERFNKQFVLGQESNAAYA